MSEQEFEAYLRLMARFLRLSEAQRKAIGYELRGHMEERLEELLARGFAREDAVNTILDEFGDAAVLSSEFSRIGLRRKWIMRTTVGTAGIAAAVLLVSFLLPENRPLSSPAYSMAGQPVASVEGTPGQPARATVQPSKSADSSIPVWPKEEAGAEDHVRDQLETKRVAADFAEGTGFEEVLRFLQEQSGISIVVSWNAISKEGIDRTTDTLGLKVKDTKFETVLSMLLANVAPDGQLGYAVEDNIIQISTLEALDHKVVTRVYDCRELIGQPKPEELARMVSAPPVGMGGGGGGGRGYGSSSGGRGMGMGPPATKPSEQITDRASAMKEYERQRVAELQDVIRTNVAPATWEPQEHVGSISAYDGLLVVTAPRRAHDGVYKLLNTMRQALAERSNREAASRGVDASVQPVEEEVANVRP